MSGQVISKTQKERAFPHHTAGDSLNQSFNISGWSDKLELNKIAARWPARAVAQFYFIDN